MFQQGYPAGCVCGVSSLHMPQAHIVWCTSGVCAPKRIGRIMKVGGMLGQQVCLSDRQQPSVGEIQGWEKRGGPWHERRLDSRAGSCQRKLWCLSTVASERSNIIYYIICTFCRLLTRIKKSGLFDINTALMCEGHYLLFRAILLGKCRRTPNGRLLSSLGLPSAWSTW